MASQGSSAIHRTVAVLLFLTVISASTANAAVVDVGGTGGWRLGATYGHLTVKRGDSLAFNYPKNAHNVLQVTATNFKSCGVSRPTKKYNSGKDTIKLSSPGTYFFICGVSEHCSSGMKVSVTVK